MSTEGRELERIEQIARSTLVMHPQYFRGGAVRDDLLSLVNTVRQLQVNNENLRSQVNGHQRSRIAAEERAEELEEEVEELSSQVADLSDACGFILAQLARAGHPDALVTAREVLRRLEDGAL